MLGTHDERGGHLAAPFVFIDSFARLAAVREPLERALAAERPRAEAEDRDLEAGGSELAIFHVITRGRKKVAQVGPC
jgi:hypothetical protein